MKIDLFQIGNFHVRGYGFMIGLGFLLALVLGCKRAKKLELKDESVIDIAILAIIGGFLGAKILYVIVSFKDFLKDPLAVLGSEGFVVYGGIIAGVLAAWIYCKVKKLVFLEYFDLIMPEVALAQGFGRIGCFLAGCCPADSMAPAGIKLIPTQLLSAAGDFLIAAILIWIAHRFLYQQKKLITGDIGSIYLLLYGIGRFLIEFLRNDYRGAVGFLSTSQFISVFIVALGVTLMVYHRKKNPVK